MLYLAPDIQEQLLWLVPLKRGREVITENRLRRLALEPHWERQRERFAELLSRRAATRGEASETRKLSPVRFVQNDLAGRRESAAFLLARADAAPLKPPRRP